MQELEESTRAYLGGEPYSPEILPHPYAFNVFSHNSAVDPDTGYNGEESKIMQEAPKIFGRPPAARCRHLRPRARIASPLYFHQLRVRAPDHRRGGARAGRARVWRSARRYPARNYFPMPRDASGQDDILVGRIRQDPSDPSGRSVFSLVAGDQLLKGAALNAVQIAEAIVGRTSR